MKKRLVLLISVALAALSFATFAVPSPPAPAPGETGQLRPSGTVSVTGASDLDDLQARLAIKAHAEGALGYYINAASSGNKMFGTAIIYK